MKIPRNKNNKRQCGAPRCWNRFTAYCSPVPAPLSAMNHVYRLTSVFLAITAMIQLFGIGERVHHALWQWYKFADYSNDGYTTLGATMVVATFILSSCAIFVAWLIYKCLDKQLWVAKVAMYSGCSFCLGIALLSALLMSPLAQVVQR